MMEANHFCALGMGYGSCNRTDSFGNLGNGQGYHSMSINAHTLDMALKKQGREGGRSLQEEGAGEVGRVEGGGAEEGAGMRNEEGGVVGKAGGLKARGRGAVEAKPEREDKRKNKHINLLNTFLKSMEEKPFHSRLNCTL